MSATNMQIKRLGHLGDGIADGPVFAPGALPGEVVTGQVTGDRLSDLRIVTPSPDRVRPPCRHYKSCGGCALQHASDGFVAAWKADVVRMALAAHGIEAEIAGVATSPPATRRRAVLHGQRTKSGTIVGLNGRGSHNLVDIPDCQLLHPGLMAALPALHALTRIGASRKTRMDFAVTLTLGGVDISARGGKDADRAMLADLAAISGAHDLARLTWNDDPVVTARPPAIAMGRARVVPPPGAFLQATVEAQATMTGLVDQITGRAGRIADLFAGCGTFALPLSERAEVHAVEGDAALLDAAAKGWRAVGGLHRLTVEARDLFHRPLQADELARFDAVVIDPPRAGAEAQSHALAAAPVPMIAAISCNPVTFARDAAILTAAGYRIGPVTVIDQFRWSPHIEVAAGFYCD